MAKALPEPLLHLGLEGVEPPLQPDEAPFDLQGQVVESVIDPGELAIDPSERPVNLRELTGPNRPG